MSTTITNAQGRGIAASVSRETGKQVQFIEFDGKRLHFSVKQYRTYKTIHRDGSVTPSRVTDRWEAPSTEVYRETACYPEQTVNGDLVFFVKHGLTQEVHERWESAA